MPAPKARLARRFVMRIPLHFHLLQGPPVPEQAGDSMNVSRNGLYFATDVSVRPGQAIELRLKMPEVVTGKPETSWRVTGRITHVERAQPPGQKFGVGVHFLYYEVAGAETLSSPHTTSEGTTRSCSAEAIRQSVC